MNIFLHDFKTLEDFNDVAEWIKNSGLDPAKNAVVFCAHLDHGDETSGGGLTLIGNFTLLLAKLTEATAQLLISGTKDKQRALQMAGMVSAALSASIASDYETIKRRHKNEND